MDLYIRCPKIVVLLFVLSLNAGLFETVRGQSRQVSSFDSDWRFFKGDAQNAEKPDFDDSSWRKLDVPHDWSIEGPFDSKNKTGGAGGFLPAGIGWYRKHFTLPTDYSDRRI